MEKFVKCSPEECQQRSSSEDLSLFEIDGQTLKPRHDWMIASYLRNQTQIRTLADLRYTLSFIWENIIYSDVENKLGCQINLKKGRIDFCDIWIFILDKSKAIRSEFVMINDVGNKQIINMLEEIIRFHILSLYYGMKNFANGGYMEYENIANIHIIMIDLITHYQFNWSINQKNDNQDEFLQYFIMLYYNQPIQIHQIINKLQIYDQSIDKIYGIINLVLSNECPNMIWLTRELQKLTQLQKILAIPIIRKFRLDLIQNLKSGFGKQSKLDLQSLKTYLQIKQNKFLIHFLIQINFIEDVEYQDDLSSIFLDFNRKIDISKNFTLQYDPDSIIYNHKEFKDLQSYIFEDFPKNLQKNFILNQKI